MQEGIQPDQLCYQQTNVRGKYGFEMEAKNEFWKSTGYRLPTEAEWEYACRAGTVTSRYYGLTDRLLPMYAWFLNNGKNHTWPMGRAWNRHFGSFDMLGERHGVVFHDTARFRQKDKDKAFDDTWPKRRTSTQNQPCMRGGAYNYPASGIRSASRNEYPPVPPVSTIGSVRPMTLDPLPLYVLLVRRSKAVRQSAATAARAFQSDSSTASTYCSSENGVMM